MFPSYLLSKAAGYTLSSYFKRKIVTSLTMRQFPEALSQAGLQFSGATEEDFDEIMGISQGIDGGLDYLPTRYMDWLQETNRTVILARKQGKVAGVTGVQKEEDGCHITVPLNNNKRFSKGVEVSISACWMTFALKEVGHFSSSLDGVSDPKRRLKSWRI
ncbi:hypothetical protein NQZ68_019435 [Dissostichus eleginoides]|nr:hypothetical protein NQZ68_019435 [Dissostichus eleginoides]